MKLTRDFLAPDYVCKLYRCKNIHASCQLSEIDYATIFCFIVVEINALNIPRVKGKIDSW